MPITSEEKAIGGLILVTILVFTFWVYVLRFDDQDANRIVFKQSGSQTGSMVYILPFAEGCVLQCEVSDSGTVHAYASATFEVYLNESLIMTETVAGSDNQNDYYDNADVLVWEDWTLQTSINSTIRVNVTQRSGYWSINIYRGTQALNIQAIFLPLIELSMIGIIIMWCGCGPNLLESYEANKNLKKYYV